MKKLTLFLLGALVFASSCNKDEPTPEDTTPKQPNTYSFSNVDYSGQTARLDMLAELTVEMKKPATGVAADENTMLNMFANENAPFADGALNASSKQLKNKCYDGGGNPMTVSSFEYYMTRLASVK